MRDTWSLDCSSNGPKLAHVIFLVLCLTCSKKNQISRRNLARRKRRECDISGKFPRIAQNCLKQSKTSRNGQFEQIPILMLEFPRAVCGMAQKQKHFKILTKEHFLRVYSHRELKFGLTPWFVKSW